MINNSIFTTLGASNHTEKVREVNDYYATDAIAIDGLSKVFSIPKNIWECASGENHLVDRLKALGCNVYATDIVDRCCQDKVCDFLTTNEIPFEYDCILSNPPYKSALDFILHSLDLLKDGQCCIMFLKTTFLEGKKRYNELFSKYPPKYMFQFVNRVLCAKNVVVLLHLRGMCLKKDMKVIP